jgi:transcriptional regulator with XRE-family HTH domain
MPKSSIMNTFGTNIELLLEERGWTKQQLADAIDMDRSSLSKIIRGLHSPSLLMVERIAVALKVEAFELLQRRQLVG